MFQNETNSVIKTVVDGWFEQSLIPWFTNQSLDYNNFLEDTIWCNDRIINEYAGWNPNGGSNYNYLTFNSDKKPYYDSYDFLCSNKKDSFTVNETTTGNGLLTYPVGLLTKDEAGLAGIYNGSNTTNYLYTGRDWWTMTPTSFWDRTASIMAITSDGYFSGYYATANNGVRPSISLSNKLKVVVGTDGTANNPYQIIMN